MTLAYSRVGTVETATLPPFLPEQDLPSSPFFQEPSQLPFNHHVYTGLSTEDPLDPHKTIPHLDNCFPGALQENQRNPEVFQPRNAPGELFILDMGRWPGTTRQRLAPLKIYGS
ncbi:uncharacterized protein LOC144304566 [Canis aureus]